MKSAASNRRCRRTCYGGFFTPSDATGDIHKFTRGLADACIRRGASFIQEADVDAIARGDDGFRIGWSEAPAQTPTLRRDTNCRQTASSSAPAWRAAISRACSTTASMSIR